MLHLIRDSSNTFGSGTSLFKAWLLRRMLQSTPRTFKEEYRSTLANYLVLRSSDILTKC